jgi:pyruvate dehydrogenase E1 component alpha subunit
MAKVKDETHALGVLTPRADELLDKMLLVRAFEEKAEELYMLGKTHGTMHLSIGQEATAVGASAALKEGDYLLNTHRGHGHCLAWFGANVDAMMAEFMGRETGYCRGRGGSMHIANVDMNNLGANGIVGGGIPISTGVGMSIKLRKTDQVCLTVFGDGASNEGAFHESLNMASIWKLPVIYLCENNQYAMSMSIKKSAAVERISTRASSYNMPGITVDGNDVLAMYEAVCDAATRARHGAGPTLIEALTYRYKGHSRSDKQAYRTRDEVAEWQKHDPIRRWAQAIGLSEAQLEGRKVQAQQRIDQSVAFAEASPEPSLDSIMEGVYA